MVDCCSMIEESGLDVRVETSATALGAANACNQMKNVQAEHDRKTGAQNEKQQPKSTGKRLKMGAMVL